jgi:uncharacterized repeat protein (TIGR02543 family)
LGAGIGSGYRGTVGSIFIKGGIVGAYSEGDGAGLGSGSEGWVNGKIEITGGTVNTASDSNGAGVGAGKNGTVTSGISITGGNVYPSSGNAEKVGRGTGGMVNGVIQVTLPVKVYFNTNGGSTPPAEHIYHYGDNYRGLPTSVKRAGYTLTGWFTAPSGGTQIKNGMKMDKLGAHTLYAHWTAKQYSVTFNAAGGKPASTVKTVTFNKAYGELPTPTWTMHKFLGWYTAAKAGKRVSKTTIYETAGNSTLYAHWVNLYTVSFEAGKGKVGTKRKIVTSGSTYGKLPTAKRKGYTFLGWFTKKSGGVWITAATKVTITKNTNLYAHWRARQYTVSFKVNKGKKLAVSKRVKKVTYEKKYGKLPKATRKGYKFLGWFTKKSGGNRVTTKSKLTTAKNTNLYAHWEKKQKKKK